MSVPRGFLYANELINSLDDEIVKQVLLIINRPLDEQHLLIKKQNTQQLTNIQIDSILNGINFILLTKNYTELSKEKAQLFENNNNNIKNNNIPSNIGTLEKLEYRLIVNIANKQVQKNLKNAMINLKFYIKKTKDIQVHIIDLTLTEFKAFAQNCKNIYKIIQNV